MVTSIIIAAVVSSAILVWLSVSQINSAPQAREEIKNQINANSDEELEKIKNEISAIIVSNPELKELGEAIYEAWEGLWRGETDGAITAYQMVMAMDEELQEGDAYLSLEHLLLSALRRVN